MKLLTLTTLAIALVGCGASVQNSNPRSVTIYAIGPKHAQPLADQECAKYGRYARLAGSPSDLNFLFHCVE